MITIDRPWRVVLIALVATICAVGLVRAEARGQGGVGQAVRVIVTTGVE